MIERSPRGIAVRGEQVLTLYVIEVCVAVDVITVVEVVAAAFAPDEASADESIALHCGIYTGHHLVNVVLLIPEIILAYKVLGLDVNEIATACHHQTREGQCGYII